MSVSAFEVMEFLFAVTGCEERRHFGAPLLYFAGDGVPALAAVAVHGER